MKILLHNRFWGLVLLVTMCYVMPVFGEVRENWFGKFHLCSDALPNTESVPARSKLVCAAVCSAKDTCTACSYLSNGTCNLHYGDLTPHTCPTAVTASAHFQKVKSFVSGRSESKSLLRRPRSMINFTLNKEGKPRIRRNVSKEEEDEEGENSCVFCRSVC